MANKIEAVLMVNFFWALAVTLLAYTLPYNPSPQTFATVTANTTNLESMATQLQNTVTAQTQIPVIDLGALIFYSGNILIDFLVNFINTVPSMITGLVHIILLFGNVDATIALWIKLGIYILVMIVYSVWLLSLILGMRTGRAVV